MKFTSERSGAALVLVMGFLVMITALVIAFFSSVSTEFSGARQYAGGATAKQLADSTVQTVIGTIKLATSGTTSSGNTASWASQPGMIRTYDTAGAEVACYKLYSSDSMIVTGPSTFDGSSDFDTSWASKPALFTDLNAPIVSGTRTVFPILDGNSVKILTKTPSGADTTPYLGYDANSDGLPDVYGFGIDPSKVNYDSGLSVSATNTPVPMPTKWIYVLQDGTLTAPDDTSASIATFNNAPDGKKPTATNPITGRMAFWTDDETSKVNINTASEGSYWDVPRVSGSGANSQDRQMALSQPVNHEFQRYPGHPATTSLSAVFPLLWSGTDPLQNESIYAITPRVSGGGSVGGTVITGSGALATAGSINTDKDRLYASIDELIFQPTLASGTRPTQGIPEPMLERARFFITASSRAPDVNLFNQPRICIWPISSTSGTDYRTAFDNVFAFCSTIGGDIYYFQRSNPDSGTADLPNAGAATGLGRNRILLDYLHHLTSLPIPGFGGTLQAKYATQTAGGGTDCDQILTEIFDYIRCTNLNDSGVTTPFALGTTSGSWQGMGFGQVVPIQDGVRGTRGLGRFPTIDKAFFMFIGNAQNPLPSSTNSIIISMPTPADMNFYDTGTNASGVLDSRMRVQAGFFMEPFCPSYGHTFIMPKFKVEVSGLNNIKWGALTTGTATNANLPQGSGTTTGTVITAQIPFSTVPSGTFMTPPRYPGPASTDPWAWSMLATNTFIGGNMGFESLVLGKGIANSGSYPFISTTATSTGTDATSTRIVTTSDIRTTDKIYFSGGDVVFKLYNSAGTTVVQTGTLSFPPSPTGGWPLPKLASTTPMEGKVKGSGDRLGNFRFFVTGATTVMAKASSSSAMGVAGVGGRLNSVGNGTGIFEPGAWITDADVVRSIEIASGDPRIAAARAGVSAASYAAHANYFTGNTMAHSLRTAAGYPFYGATVGRLFNLGLASASLTTTSYPNYCSSLTGNYSYQHNVVTYDTGNPSTTGTGIYVGGATDFRQIPGDWDNAYGHAADGAYINKADEGDGNGNGTSIPYYEWATSELSNTTSTLFSPNRQVPSAVTFGSLPSGVFANKPWQTLLFRSLPAGHPGLGVSVTGTNDDGPPYSTPPDHLLLDLFNMPVVEPYPISEPLSTAGRINMNFQIAPFTYITRSTAIRAVLKSEQVIAIADAQSTAYKNKSTASIQVRYPVNADETLKGFTARFSKHDLFRSASEICSIHLVPADSSDANATYEKMPDYWLTHRPTGDNSRERPYATIYPRLTTKSNTFTVYFRVQTLQKGKGSAAGVWDEKRDAVMSEYRGSQTIERYIDPADTNIPDYAQTNTANPIDMYYRFRVLNSKKF